MLKMKGSGGNDQNGTRRLWDMKEIKLKQLSHSTNCPKNLSHMKILHSTTIERKI